MMIDSKIIINREMLKKPKLDLHINSHANTEQMNAMVT